MLHKLCDREHTLNLEIVVTSRIKKYVFFLSETAKTKPTEDDSELDISALCPKVTFFQSALSCF